MSLRRAYLVYSAVLAIVGVLLAVALVVVTTSLHRGANEVRAAAEGLRLGEDIESELVTMRDAPDYDSRVSAAEVLRRKLGEANRYVGTGNESDILSDMHRKVDTFIADPSRQHFDNAYAATRDWTAVNLEQSRAVGVLEARWDRIADVIALVALAIIVGGIGALSWWLRRRTVSPALQLVKVIDRYASGERTARAREEGAQELRTIAHQFNDMASTLETQRADQLTFLAGVAHDLRNPLTALKLGVAMMPADKPLPPEQRTRQLIARIAHQIDRLDRMVFDLLDASQIEAGHLSLVLERCDLRDLVRATADLLEPLMLSHKLVVSTPDAPVIVTCDCMRMEQVMANLLTNAVRYSPEGGTVTVCVTEHPDNALLSVTDDGTGIAPDDLKRVFEPFRRGPVVANPPAGLGLGMFVARRIVRAHGGDVTVESTAGVGATYTLRLPIARGA